MQIKTKEKVKCPNCNSTKTIKRGKRKRKFREVQQFQCKSCKKFFLQEKQALENQLTIYTDFRCPSGKNKTYPINIILKALSTYNLGHNLQQTSEKLKTRYNTKIPISTLSSWLNQYKNICTYARLRKQSIKNYSPKNIIEKQTLNHIQPYIFKYHKAKLDVLLKENSQFTVLKNYIEKIATKNFPHHIFTYHRNPNWISRMPKKWSFFVHDKTINNNNDKQRASQIKFNHLQIKKIQKNNFACKLASLALSLATTNKQRHEAIQNFFLINDSTTIATEIPIYLTNWDAGYYRNRKGFIFLLNNYKTPITGHIDILQIRNGLIQILDYKPDADKTNAVEQLTIYALALSRKLNLPLYYFKAAWFDENNYYEFFPLHGVYEKRKV
jgi:predicted RNA-binding Zn-ribbon protein involved in translation (DUF1610 family)